MNLNLVSLLDIQKANSLNELHLIWLAIIYVNAEECSAPSCFIPGRNSCCKNAIMLIKKAKINNIIDKMRQSKFGQYINYQRNNFR